MNVNHNIKNMKTAKLGKPYQIIFKMSPNQTYQNNDLNFTKSSFNPDHGHVDDSLFWKKYFAENMSHPRGKFKEKKKDRNEQKRSDFIARSNNWDLFLPKKY